MRPARPVRSRLLALLALAAAARCGGQSSDERNPGHGIDVGPDDSGADVVALDATPSNDAVTDEPGSTDDAVPSDGTEPCQPGDVEPCYDGPAGTSGVGICHPGLRVCKSNATFGDCVGQALPKEETCATPFDDDCDGVANEEGNDCSCVADSQIDCYTGAMEGLGIGACKSGSQVCVANGHGYGACTGEVLPSVENCATPEDEDCDGEPDCPGDLQWLLVPEPNWLYVNSIARGSGTKLALLTYPPRTWSEVETTGVVSVIQADPPNYYTATGPDVLGGAPDGASELLVGTYSGASTWATLLPSDGSGVFVMQRNGWQRGFPGSYVSVTSATMHPTESPAGWYLGGPLSGSLELEPGTVITGSTPKDSFVMKVDASNGASVFGRHLFEPAPGSSSFDAELSGLQATAAGVVVAGTFGAAVSLDGVVLQSKGGNDVFLGLMDGKGNVLGAYSFGGTGPENVKIVGRTGVAPIVVAGTHYGMTIGTVSFVSGTYLLRFSDALKAVSAQQWPGCTAVIAAALDDVTEDAYLVLYCQTENDFGGGPLPAGTVLIAIDQNNQHRFSRALPNAAKVAHMLALDGALYLTGEFDGTVDFGAGIVASKTPANSGTFVVRMTK